MEIRAMQIWGFLLAFLGWTFVACSMAMEGWKISSVGGQGGSSIVYVGWYWSSLWRACYTDSAATSNCYDFPVLWSVEGYLQIVRALLMSGMGVGVLGFVLSLVGMECTYIGGNDKEKNRAVCTAGICHIASGLLAASGYAMYAQNVSADYFNPKFDGLEYELGTPLFLGWTGCAFEMAGGSFFLVSVTRIWSQTYSNAPVLSVPVLETNALRGSRTNISIISELSTKSNPSAISELSSKSEISDLSQALSKKTRVSRTERPSRSRHSEKSRVSVGSEGQSVSSTRTSRTSRSHLHNIKKSTAMANQFIKNSYI